MIPDRELLQRYAREDSQEAFTELVRRHVDLVYGSARRQLCGNGTLAADVTQAVFTALATKIRTTPDIRHLAAWLHATTRFTVSHTVRSERRRQEREQQAHAMHSLTAGPASPETAEISPELVDHVLAQLAEEDREAILLRFLEGQSFAALATVMGTSEDAARMRVNRALEKLRTHFSRNGIASSSAVLGAALTQQVVAAPAGLATTVATTALGTAAALAGAAGAKAGLLTLMTTTKSLWIAGAAVIAALGFSTYEYCEDARRDEEIARLTREQDRLRDELKQAEGRTARLSQHATLAEQRLAESQRPPALPPVTRSPVPAFSPPDPEKAARAARKMAEMKPLLEAGLPVTGAIVVFVDGKPKSLPVSFVIGKETRVEGDDGAYIMTPSLERDGTIFFRFAMQEKGSDGALGPSKDLHMNVITNPWTGFALGLKGGKVLAFDPDMAAP